MLGKIQKSLMVLLAVVLINTNTLFAQCTNPVGPVQGPASVCKNSTGIAYSVSSITGASSYTWAVTGGTIQSGNGTTAISVDWGSSASGTVTVTLNMTNPSDPCDGSQATLNVNLESPFVPVTETTLTGTSILNGASLPLVTVAHCYSGCNRDISKASLNILFNLGDDYEFGKNTFETSVEVKITGYSTTDASAGSEVITYYTLIGLTEQKPEQLYSVSFLPYYNSISSFEATIINYDSDPMVNDDIELKLYYSLEFSENVAAVQPVLSTPVGTNPVTFRWNKGGCTCELYNWEIQILKLDNIEESAIDGSGSYNSAVTFNVDWDRALKIETQSADTFITLTLAEGSGYYAWRVRPIGNYYTLGTGIADYRNWGTWSEHYQLDVTTPADIELSSITTGNHLFYYNQFSGYMNWIYSRVFTEGTPENNTPVRIGEQVQYATGLNNVIQEQTKINSNGSYIIAKQNILDFSGRPALTTIPVPIDQDSVGYRQNLVKGCADTIYSARYFDDDDHFGSVNNYSNPAKIFSNLGNEPYDYYSDYNSDVSIPSADGYPFIRIRYEADGTDWIKEESGVGDSLRVKQGTTSKTIKHYYSSVANDELIRVFGDEAPAGLSVQKEIVVDQNKVASVKYVDKEGKVLATCLSKNGNNVYGGEHQTLDGLESQLDDDIEVVNIIDSSYTNDPYVKARTTRLVVTEEKQVTIYYQITPNQIEALCEDYCKTCDYKVEVYVQEQESLLEDPNRYVDYRSKIVSPVNTSIFSNGVYTSDCASTIPTDSIIMYVTLYPDSVYFISMRIRPLEIGEVAALDTATYIQNYLAELENNYIARAEDYLDTYIYPYLDNNDLVGLYEFLFNAEFDTISQPDVYYADSTAYIAFDECGQIGIPVYLCPIVNCDSVSFIDIFLDAWADSTQYTGTDANDRYDFLNNLYTEGELNDVISNMIDSGYSCKDLYDCWVTTTLAYPYFLESMTLNPVYSFDFITEFVNCTGRTFSCVTTGDSWLENPASCFQYVLGTNTLCEQMINDGVAFSTQSEIENLPDSLKERLYYCIHGNISTAYSYSGGSYQDLVAATDSTIDAMEEECFTMCEAHATAFESELIQLYHDSLNYIVGDSLTLVQTPWGMQPVGTTLDTTGIDFVDYCSINCQVHQFLETCRNECDLVPIIDNGHYAGAKPANYPNDHFTEIMTGTFELMFSENPDACVNDSNWFSIGGNCSVSDIWDVTQGTTLNEKNNFIIETPDSALVLGGQNGSTDIYFTSLFKDGTILWSESSLSQAGNEEVIGLIQRPTGHLVFGGNADNGYYCFSYDTVSAQSIWSWIYSGSSTDSLISIQSFDNGDILLAGFSNSNATAGIKTSNTLGGYDYWVARVDTTGSRVWDLTLGSSEDDILRSVSPTHDGGFILAGFTQGGADNTYSYSGQYRKTTTNIGSYDIWIVKIDGDGNVEWEKSLGGIKDDFGYSVIENDDFSFIVAGSSNSFTGTTSDYDYIAYRLTQAGNIEWEKTYGSGSVEGEVPAGDGYAKMQVFKTPQGFMIGGSAQTITANDVTATRTSLGNGNYDYWAVSIRSNGNYLWDRALGAEEYEYFAGGLALEDEYVFTGKSNSNAAGDKTDNCIGGYDFWTIRFGNYCSPPEYRSICIRWYFPEEIDSIPEYSHLTCEEDNVQKIRDAIYAALYDENGYIDSLLTNFEDSYTTYCLTRDSINDLFWVGYPLGYHHYTLYYYDRAGNLVKTVPPEGVDFVELPGMPSPSQYGTVQATPRDSTPHHRFITDYRTNSIKEAQRQHSPDGGEAQYFYNAMQQLRFSINTKQYYNPTASGGTMFSYLKYDDLGRVIESGESYGTTFPSNVDDPAYPTTNCRYVTHTVYTEPASGITFLGGQEQRHLQNRVSYTYTDVDGDGNFDRGDIYIYYSYDPHGNVEWMIYNFPELGEKYLEYEYDQVSGNVKEVKINEGLADQFYQRYTYDTDNRIILVETSTDGKMWDSDARYDYYQHGPLRRMEIGEDKLQGVDYTYTAQGWLKAVNHPLLNIITDPGDDGSTALGSKYAPDLFGMQLGYFIGDFQRTGSYLNHDREQTLNPVSYSNLYNGNIASWTSNTDFQGNSVDYSGLNGYRFRYDEIYRLKWSDFYTYDDPSWVNDISFTSRYNYDANGNIRTLSRMKAGSTYTNSIIDSLDYQYYDSQFTPSIYQEKNWLMSVTDQVAGYSTDLYGTHIYDYDSIGNLVKDTLVGISTEGIDTILWTPSGKVAYVDEKNSQMPDLYFYYDPLGNRAVKFVEDQSDSLRNETYYYLRDAQGNILAIYRKYYEEYVGGIYEKYSLENRPIYGSARIGTQDEPVLVKYIDYPTGDDAKEIDCNVERIAEGMWLSPASSGRDNLFIAIPYPYNPSSPATTSHVQLAHTYSPTAQLNPFYLDRRVGKSDINMVNPTPQVFPIDPKVIGCYSASNLYVQEDREGHILFTAMTFKNYNNNHDVCLVFDRDNHLLQNCYNIHCIYDGRIMATPVPGSETQYYLFTFDKFKNPVYHVVDISSNTIVSKNNDIDPGTSGNWGHALALFEDHTGQYSSRLFLRKWSSPNTTTIYSCEITSLGMGNPVSEASLSGSLDSKGLGDMMISPDGNKFIVMDYTNRTLLFLDNAKFHIFTLKNDYSDLELNYTTTGVSGLVNVKNFDISPDSRMIVMGVQLPYYVTGTMSGYIKRLSVDYFNTDIILNNYTGSIRRARNGKMYVCRGGQTDMKEIVSPNNNIGVASVVNTISVITDPNWQLTSYLPLYPHKLYPLQDNHYERELGNKEYELSDHLGNVRAVFSDIKNSTASTGVDPYDFEADLLSAQDYYPGGSLMPGRNYNSNDYKFGYQGSEKDDEITGTTGSHYTTYFRELDTRIVRWWTVDPKSFLTPWESPYMSMGGNPILLNDPMGDLKDWYKDKKTGNTFWREGNAATVTSEAGNESENIGKSYSAAIGGDPDNGYVNFYQNQQIGITSNPMDFSQKKGFLLGSSSLLSKTEKMDFFGTANTWLEGAGYLSGGIGAVQIGLLEYRSSLDVMRKINTFSQFSSTYKALGTTGKVLGKGANWVGAPISLGLDIEALNSGDIGVGRFTYRQTGLAASIAGGAVIGSSFGGPWGAAAGALIGASFVAGEYIYDGVKYIWDETLWQISNFENAINSGEWYPGK